MTLSIKLKIIHFSLIMFITAYLQVVYAKEKKDAQLFENDLNILLSDTNLLKQIKPLKPSARLGKQNSKNSYWDTLYFIESSAGKTLFRQKNKARSCKWTITPCGHHQLSVTALNDIGCTTLKCRSAREDYQKSLSMSKKLEEINTRRMQQKGYKTLPDYQRYLVHQQGATGLGKILDAANGKKSLPKKLFI